MLTTHNETSETDVLSRIRAARSESEPVEPTEESEQPNTEQGDSDNPEPLAAQEEQLTDEVDEDVSQDQEAQAEEQAEPAEEVDEEVYQVGEYEFTESELKAWKSGHMMQSDYTKKTTELASERKAFEEEKVATKEELATLREQLKAQLSQVSAVIQEGQLSQEQLAELKEDDPAAYLEYQEKQERLQTLVNGANQSVVDRQAVNQAVAEANPDWIEDGQTTEKFQSDMALVRAYTAELGYPEQELAGIQRNGDVHHWLTLLDAARGREAIKQLAEIKAKAESKRDRKPPTVTKPKAQTKTSLDRQIEAAQARLKKSGKPEDAAQLRILKRKRGK